MEKDNLEKIESEKTKNLNTRRNFLGFLGVGALAGIFSNRASANDLFLTSTSDPNAQCMCIQPATVAEIYARKDGTVRNATLLEEKSLTQIKQDFLSEGDGRYINLSSTTTESNMKIEGGKVFMYVSGGWKQIFPAVYS